MDLEILLRQIERMRTDINELHEKSVLTDDEVLHKSRKLDELLIAYERFVKR